MLYDPSFMIQAGNGGSAVKAGNHASGKKAGAGGGQATTLRPEVIQELKNRDSNFKIIGDANASSAPVVLIAYSRKEFDRLSGVAFDNFLKKGKQLNLKGRDDLEIANRAHSLGKGGVGIQGLSQPEKIKEVNKILFVPSGIKKIRMLKNK